MAKQTPETEPARPCGGYLVHAKIKGKWAALCGYKPSAPNRRLMRDRSGWCRVKADTEITCTRCLKKLEQLKQRRPRAG